MCAVIFEVTPPRRAQGHFDLAAELRPGLERFDGFLGWAAEQAR